MRTDSQPIGRQKRPRNPVICGAVLCGLVQCSDVGEQASDASETQSDAELAGGGPTSSAGDTSTGSGASTDTDTDADTEADLTNLHLAVPYLQACINANHGFEDVKDSPELVVRGTVTDYGIGIPPYHCAEDGSVGGFGHRRTEGLSWLTFSDFEEPGKEWVVGMYPAGFDLNFAGLIDNEVELRFHQEFRDETRLSGVALFGQDANYLVGFEDLAAPEDWLLPTGMQAQLGPAIQEFQGWCSRIRGYDLTMKVDGRAVRQGWATTEDYRGYRLTHGGITAPHGPLEDCSGHHPHSATMLMYKRAFLSGESTTP